MTQWVILHKNDGRKQIYWNRSGAWLRAYGSESLGAVNAHDIAYFKGLYGSPCAIMREKPPASPVATLNPLRGAH